MTERSSVTPYMAPAINMSTSMLSGVTGNLARTPAVLTSSVPSRLPSMRMCMYCNDGMNTPCFGLMPPVMPRGGAISGRIMAPMPSLDIPMDIPVFSSDEVPAAASDGRSAELP